MAVIQAEWEETDIYSIDEAFLDLQSMPAHLIEEFCWGLQKKILQATGIPTSIGIGPTKTLAKAANCIAKKKLKIPVFSMVNHVLWLKELAVGDIWGVGRHGQQKLMDLGIHTAFDLIHWDTHALKTHFNLCLQRTVAELQGQACLDLVVLEKSKSILSSRSFGSIQTTYPALREAVSYHSGIVWEKLRHQHLKVKRLSVFVYTSPYRETNTVSMKLPLSTDDIRIITRYAEFCLRKLYQSGISYKKCGVLLTDLEDKQVLQYDLFTEMSEATLIQNEKTMQIIEKINHKYQSKTLYLAAEGVTKKCSMKRNRMTPCYTTKWADLALVYAK
jgi:DNA polymerase V